MPALKRTAAASKAAPVTRRNSQRKMPARTLRATARATKSGLSPPQPTLHATDRILEAAAEFFALHGYANSSLDDVAALAGLTKGAVYYYFKDKESLLLETLHQIEDRSIDTTAEKVREGGGSATDQLQRFVRYQTRWAAQHPRDLAILMLVSAETAQASERVRTQVLGIYRKLAQLLEALIEEGKASGEFSPNQETKDTVLYLQAVHDGNMMIWYRSGTDAEVGRRLARATLSGFLRTVKD
ncbi:MAG: TetR/AcrR family transcriptional regulator [Burkholderiales bacterium]|nr:TetR/AcrR family transcriptional regulator [Burkholderiales bacterium]